MLIAVEQQPIIADTRDVDLPAGATCVLVEFEGQTLVASCGEAQRAA
jgi:hypothetical protein